MASAVELRQRLRALLPTLDLAVATERFIRNKLEEEFGVPIMEHKQLIKEEIEMFLSGEAEAPGAAVGGGVGGVLPGGMRGQQPDSDDDFINDDGEEEEEGRGPSRKKIRTERGPAGNTKSASGCGEAPLYKLALSGAGGSGGHQPIKLLTVGTYKGRPHVDLREYFEKDGEQRPTQRGIALAPEQWSALRAGLPQLLDAARRQDTSFDLPLGGTRRAAVSQWKGAINVHVREYYDAGGGEMKPGKKGITVSVEGLEAMHGAAAAVDAQVAKLKGGSGDSAAAAAAGSAGAATPSGSLAAAGAGGASSSQQPLAARAHPAHKASAAAPTPPASAAAAARPPLQAPTGLAPTPSFVDLGGDKRATVSTWKGRVNVDMREYYNAGGKMKPGKKGIAVPPAEWRTIAARAADISAAAQRGDQRFALQLAPGSSRRVAVSEFKGKVYVGVREFYEKDGQSLPGAKGLSMTVDQWRRLVDGIPAVDAALAAAEGGGV